MEMAVLVALTDYRIGISTADQQKIFYCFYQISGKNKKKLPGFRMGWSKATEIVQRHYGKIGVNSQTGNGIGFYFSIPLNN